MEQVVTILKKKVGTATLCKGFGVTKLTILNWRKNKKLPFVRIKGGGTRDAIRFIIPQVLAWAKQNGKEFDTSALGA